MSQPVAEPLPGKHLVSKTITRHDFYSVLYKSDGSLYPQVQVHTFEGLRHSGTHGQISRFTLTSDTQLLLMLQAQTFKVLKNHPE